MTAAGVNTVLADYLEDWLNSATHLRLKTLEQYKQVTRNHIIPNLGKLKLNKIRPDQVQKLYNLKDTEYSAYTVRVIHSVLHKSLNQAVKWGLIPINPAALVNKPRPKKRVFTILNEDELRSLTSYPSKYQNVYYLAVVTALRRGELLGLKWTDLDWTSGTLQIRRQFQRSAKGCYFTELKSDSSRRTIVVGQATLERLKDQEERQHTDKILVGKRWIETGVIFHSGVGTPVEPRNLVREFKGTLEKTDLPEIRFPDLRHSAATLMLKKGNHPKIVQERLGHSNIGMTLDIYSHVIPGMQTDIANQMDELLSPVAVKLLSK